MLQKIIFKEYRRNWVQLKQLRLAVLQRHMEEKKQELKNLKKEL